MSKKLSAVIQYVRLIVPLYTYNTFTCVTYYLTTRFSFLLFHMWDGYMSRFIRVTIVQSVYSICRWHTQCGLLLWIWACVGSSGDGVVAKLPLQFPKVWIVLETSLEVCIPLLNGWQWDERFGWVWHHLRLGLRKARHKIEKILHHFLAELNVIVCICLHIWGLEWMIMT